MRFEVRVRYVLLLRMYLFLLHIHRFRPWWDLPKKGTTEKRTKGQGSIIARIVNHIINTIDLLGSRENK